MERKEQAKRLREEMRSERNSSITDERDRSTKQSSGSYATPSGPNIEDTRGYTEEPVIDTRETRGNDRSTQERAKRNRQDNRRFEHNSGISANRSSEARFVGLERADGIPETSQKSRKEGANAGQIKDTWESIQKALFAKKGSLLTKKEAEESYEPLKESILSCFDDMDKLLDWRVRQRTENRISVTQPIWSNITDFEAETQAKLMIKRGMSNVYAAETVRKFIAMKDYISVGVMYLPRIQLTVDVLRIAEEDRRENKNKQ